MQLVDYLRNQLTQFGAAQRYDIAYSGGLDSHVLLHAMAQLRAQRPDLFLRAIHVHHGLSPYADHWVEHCRAVCIDLDMDFHCEYLCESPPRGESVEAWARAARYRVFAQYSVAGTVLLTAHTQDDQAETLLLQLLRGAGPKGLAAMPQQQALGAGTLLRPLLQWTRRQLKMYATQQLLSWIEDESNADDRFDRNFLRRQVLPMLTRRWPAAVKNLARSAEYCAQAASGLAELAQLDLAGEFSEVLPIDWVRALPPARQSNVLRYWLSQCGCQLPSARRLQQIQQTVIDSRVDAQPQVSWGEWTVRRYRQNLIVSPSTPTVILSGEQIAWDLTMPLSLPYGLGYLSARQQTGRGVSLAIKPECLTIRFRRGGERCRLAGKTQSTSLKKLFQQWGVPPWQRARVPLLYHGDELVAIIGYAVCAPFTVSTEEVGWVITAFD